MLLKSSNKISLILIFTIKGTLKEIKLNLKSYSKLFEKLLRKQNVAMYRWNT